MKNLDRYTVTSLYLADFLSDPVRQILLRVSQCDHLTEASALLDSFCAAIEVETAHILHTNPAAMKKLDEDTRICGFFESELSRRLRIRNGEHTSRIAVCCWDYSGMVTAILSRIDPAGIRLQPALTSQVYEKARRGFRMLTSAIIHSGCFAEIGGRERRYRFFAASAGQMRKQRFILLRDDVYRRHNEAMTLGLTEETINAHGGINASKYLPYKALCLSCGREAEWFDPDKMIVIPDREISLTAVVDTVTTAYDVIRGERSDIRNPINDGIGFYWRHDSQWQPCNIQVRYAFVKGLLTPLNFVSLFRLFGKEPVVRDLWGKEHDLVQEGIEVIFTESQLKLAGMFGSLDMYRAACKQYRRAFCILNQDGDPVHASELPYQTLQSLITAEDAELEALSEKTVASLRSMLTPEGALDALGANRPAEAQSGFQQALHLLPELLGDAYTRETLSDLYASRYNTACSGRLLSCGKYRYIVPDPIALFETCFLGREPQGVLKADEIWNRHLTPGCRVDLLRSPHMHTVEHCVQTVAAFRSFFLFLNTDAVYISVHSTVPQRLMCDYDGDTALVVDDEALVRTAEHCITDRNAVPLYYEAQKAPRKPLDADALAEAVFRAADFNRIGIYSIYAVKLLAGKQPDLTVLARLTAAGNYAIDAAKTGAMIELPRDVEAALRKLDKPFWWRYGHATQEHPASDTAYWNDELAAPGEGVIDRIGRIIRGAVPEKAVLTVPADPSIWAAMCIDPCRKTVIGVIDVFKDCARRNAAAWQELFRKRPDLHEDWITAGALTEKKLAAARKEILDAAGGDPEAAYDTITRGLFRYPGETAFKRFYWQLFGDMAAQVIRNNLEKANALAA